MILKLLAAPNGEMTVMKRGAGQGRHPMLPPYFTSRTVTALVFERPGRSLSAPALAEVHEVNELIEPRLRDSSTHQRQTVTLSFQLSFPFNNTTFEP